MIFQYGFKPAILNFRYKITISTDDIAVVKCLCALSKLAQKTRDKQIACSLANLANWERNDHQVTFRFTDNRYRSTFLSEATRLLPSTLWQICKHKNDDL